MAGGSISEAGFDLDQTDRLLTTTRAVRKRLIGTGHPKEKVVSSSAYLVENMAKRRCWSSPPSGASTTTAAAPVFSTP